MKTLIAYASKYGCTERCASMLSEKLTGEVDLYNLKGARAVDLSQYDKVIIGGSIYMGRIQKEVSEFCSKNLSRLMDKKTGFFICCMREGDIAETELNTSFPQELLSNAVAKEYFGGEFIFKKMNALDRFIVKKVSKTDKDISNILEDNINRFSQLMNNA
ncbi:MAG: Flavodoxin [Firmicutes bacterium]|nr:Flavodoxin [Bacillota bacterium]MDI6704903.1 flavodoxin domain-containing protein [Bacillota bacterium]